MGANNSRENSPRNHQWNRQFEDQQARYSQPYGVEHQAGYSQPYYASEPNNYYQPPQQPYTPPAAAPPSTSAYGGGAQNPAHRKRIERMYSRIADEYTSLDQVTQALVRAGLESSNLIVGIDFTKSNEWTGAKSFNRKSLHHIGNGLNPYEQAISIIGTTLAAFDEDNLIPCYGFGDASTHDQDVFGFYSDERFCNGFEEVLSRYREIVPQLRLAGPTSFAPVIEMAMTIVERSGGQYHVLLIIADGQVTRSVDTERGRLSPQEQKTVDAIVEASKYPLSIVVVGVGDGPWDMMEEFDDNIPARDFDNFQFVNFTDIMAKNTHQTRKDTEFALSALMEIPSQYKATIELNILGRRRGVSPERVPLPTPLYNNARPFSNTSSFSSASTFSNVSSFNYSKPSHSTSFQSSASSYYEDHSHVGSAPPAPSSTYETSSPAPSSDFDNLLCPICFTNKKDMAFGCGHQTCAECGQDLSTCPICRSTIQTRIKLY